MRSWLDAFLAIINSNPITFVSLLLLAFALLCLSATVAIRLRCKAQHHRALYKQAQLLFKANLQASNDILWDWKISEQTVTRFNAQSSVVKQNAQKSIPNRALIHPDDVQHVDNQLSRHLNGQTPVFEATYRIAQNQQWRWVLDRAKVIERDEHNEPLRMTGTMRDIDDLKSTEQRLNLFAKCVQNLSDAIIIYDADFKFVDANPAYQKMFGLPLANSELLIPSLSKNAAEKLKQKLFKQGHFVGELSLYTESGKRCPFELRIDTINNDAGTFDYFIMTYSDLSEYKKNQQVLHNLSNVDSLTALPNRRQFFNDLHALMSQEQHHAMLVMDLDNFKKINDSLGHQQGDQLLVTLAQRLDKLRRDSDSLYRLGGDEFALVMRGTNDIHTISAMAKRCLEAAAQPVVVNSHELAFSTSIGIVLCPEDGNSPQQLLKNADIAMYHAKRHGNHYQFFNDPMNTQALNRLQIESLIRFGLKRDHFDIYYQPKMDIRSGRIAGVEALARFITPNQGMISPAQFIPIAEETGQIVEIGEVILDKACADIQRWQQSGLFNGRVAVNLSPRQFALPDLGERIGGIINKHQINAQSLELEITEYTVMNDPEQAITIMNALVEMGIHLAMDDFGTGYSSLAYLKRFPIHTLKIDRAFIIDMVNERGKNMVDSIITMAHNLDLHVVAEGVEERSQLEKLAQLGCETLQGYYYSKPLPREQFEAFLAKQQKRQGRSQAQLEYELG